MRELFVLIVLGTGGFPTVQWHQTEAACRAAMVGKPDAKCERVRAPAGLFRPADVTPYNFQSRQ